MFGNVATSPRRFLVRLMTYPEHDKRSAILNQSQAIGEFLDWLGQRGWHRMRWRTDLTDQQICTMWHCDNGVTNKRNGEPCSNCDGTGFVEVTDIERWWEDNRSIEQVLAEYFDIDLDKIEAERREMLASIAAAQPNH